MRELMIMYKFLGGLKSKLRERMSFKEFKTNLLNEAKLEKINVELINSISANSNSQALTETKKEAEEWKVVTEKNQKLQSDLLQQKKEKKTEETK